MMTIQDYRAGTGNRILADVTGSVHAGKGLVVLTIAPRIGMEFNLARVLEIISDELEVEIVVGSCDTGVHVINSRHYAGCAVDIIRLGDMGSDTEPVSLANPRALELVHYVLNHGWHIGEGSPAPGVILGPVHTQFNPTNIPHAGHIHLSISRPHPGLPESEGFGDAEIGGEGGI